MNKLFLVITAAISITVAANTALAAPLPAGTRLPITKTTDAAFVGPVPGCTNGSCFGMFLFSTLYAWTPLGPGTDGGIIIGKGQLSGGQEVNGLSSNNGELTEMWDYGSNHGTFFTAPSDAGNVFDDASCAGSGCGSNVTPIKTALKVWNTAWGGQVIPMGSASGCNKTSLPACTADQVAGIFVKTWDIDPAGTFPRKYRLTYSQVVPTVFTNYPFELILSGEFHGDCFTQIAVTPANLVGASGVSIPFTITANSCVATPTCRVGTAPSNGVVVLNGCASGTYTSDIGFVGTNSFTLIANDGNVDSLPFLVNVAVADSSITPTPTYTPIGEPPPPTVITYDNSLTVSAGATVSWYPSYEVLNNFGNGFIATCSVGVPPLHGSATVANNCSSGTYTAPANYIGTDSFIYFVSGCISGAPQPQYCAGDGGTVTVNVVGGGVTPTPTPISNVCTDRYPVSQFSQTGKEGTLSITFTGNITSHTNKAVKVCPGTTLNYQASSTQGPVVCKVKNNTTRGSGSLKINDHLKCTDKPIGNDKLGIKIKSGVNQKAM